MPTETPLLLALDLAGTFAFALNGALTAMKVTKVDVVGVVTLGMVTALGGGIVRDVLLGSLPPATFSDWRYLLTAAVGSLVAFGFGGWLNRYPPPILLLDAAGLGLFAVTGAGKALDLGVGAAQAVILGAVTAVGGGTVRDVLITRVPVILRRSCTPYRPCSPPPWSSSPSGRGSSARPRPSGRHGCASPLGRRGCATASTLPGRRAHPPSPAHPAHPGDDSSELAGAGRRTHGSRSRPPSVARRGPDVR